MTTADVIRIERPTTNSKFFAHTRWDAVPAAAGLFHLAYFLGLFFLYPPHFLTDPGSFIADGECEHQWRRAQLHS
jgi:hypothetical protein